MPSNGETPLERLAAEAGWEFPNLLAARERAAAGLTEHRELLAGLRHDPDASVVLMGSWGRAEVTSGSDHDFMVLVDGEERDVVVPAVEDVEALLSGPEGEQGVFGELVFCRTLAENIGLDRDDNSNLTRRMLLMLESVPVSGDRSYQEACDKVLSRYLGESIKDFRPPRFLLNDTVRYWRTICVDFAGKEMEGPRKWGIRNAKLRTSRKVLFAGGLLPVLDCARLDSEAIPEFLRTQLTMSPTDRIAWSFLEHQAADAGARALGAYDEFLGLLDGAAFRQALYEVPRETAAESSEFAEVARLGRDLEKGLLALLFETDTLSRVVRDYAIF